MNQDKRNLTVAIERACAQLCALKDGLHCSAIATLELQAESALLYSDYARQIATICDDVLIEAVEIAANLGNRDVSATERADMRVHDAMDEILSDARDWADDAVQERAA